MHCAPVASVPDRLIAGPASGKRHCRTGTKRHDKRNIILIKPIHRRGTGEREGASATTGGRTAKGKIKKYELTVN